MKADSEKKRARDRRDTIIMLAILALIVASLVVMLVLILRTDAPGGATEPATQLQTAAPQPPDAPTATEAAEPMPYDIEGFTQLTDVTPAALTDELRLLYAGYYTGKYVEDGSDEAAENVLALIVENTGADIIEYAQISLLCDGKPVQFALSGLPAQGRCFVLAQERAAYADGMTLETPACTQLAPLGDRAVLDFGSDFALYPADGVLNLQNISGAALDSDVSLCYKNYRDGLFWGGIAYRAAFPGGFAADETRQSLQSHYTVDGSVILYMLYEAA